MELEIDFLIYTYVDLLIAIIKHIDSRREQKFKTSSQFTKKPYIDFEQIDPQSQGLKRQCQSINRQI